MRDAVDRSPAASAGSPTPTQPEATDRAIHTKESQSCESSFLGGIVDASPPLAPTAAAPAPTVAAPAPALSPQASLSLLSPSSHNHATPVAGSHAASPSKSRFSSVRFADGVEGQTASFKRSPIKVGYLFKQSSGSWKRKRWNQRWFVLDTEMGILKYFRHESLPEAVPFRQDAHGVIHLKEPGASLVIQGDLPRNVPTPFCFTVFDGNRSFLICADSNQEFREWTSAISAILSPRKLTADGVAPGSPNATTSRRASTDSALDRAVSLPVVSAQVVTQTDTKLENERASSPSSSLTKRDADALVTSIHKGSDATPSLPQTVIALAVFNSVAVIVRYGSVECLYASLLGVNAFFVWALWFQKPAVRPVSLQCIRHDDDTSANSATDDSSSGVAGQPPPSSPRGRDSKSSQPDSPRKATLPRLEKLPSVSFQPTKFLGTINGVKAKAGDSVKMCPPAPAAIITGCWTQISGTRFQVRQGPNYRKTKHKAPSEESLLELLAIDIYRSPSKIDNVASIVDLGDLKPENSPLDLFIVNCQVPSYQPSNPLWGEKQGNGVGFNFVSYFSISPEIRQQLKEHEPGDQAVRLLKNFMQDNSSVRDRFKAIGIVVNPQEQQQLGRTERHLLETYNGQPILTRPQHRFYRGDGYFEVDVDAHEFNYVARKGLAGVSDHFRNMVVDFGFVLEGQDDLELPEQMLGCVRLCKIDVRQALEIT